MVMQSPCADAALDLPLWIVPNKALFLSRAINVKHIVTIVTVEKKIHLDRAKAGPSYGPRSLLRRFVLGPMGTVKAKSLFADFVRTIG
jgi:hypothetical protein